MLWKLECFFARHDDDFALFIVGEDERFEEEEVGSGVLGPESSGRKWKGCWAVARVKKVAEFYFGAGERKKNLSIFQGKYLWGVDLVVLSRQRGRGFESQSYIHLAQTMSP